LKTQYSLAPVTAVHERVLSPVGSWDTVRVGAAVGFLQSLEQLLHDVAEEHGQGLREPIIEGRKRSRRGVLPKVVGIEYE